MKNFIFPQIFHPVLVQNDSMNLTQWHMTSKRIQTENQLITQNARTHKNIKTSRLNFFLKATKTSAHRNEPSDFTVEHSLNLANKKTQGDEIEINLRFGTEGCQAQNSYNQHLEIPKQNTSRVIGSSTFRILKQRSLNIEKNKQTNEKNFNRTSAELQLNGDENKENVKKNNKSALNKQKNGITKVKGKKQTNVRISYPMKKQKQSKKKLKQKSAKSKKEVQSNGDSQNISQKAPSKVRSRRNGAEAIKPDFQFELTEKMIKVIQSNTKLLAKTSLTNVVNIEIGKIHENEAVISNKTSKSIVTISMKSIGAKPQGKRSMTFHVIEEPRNQVRSNKRTFTIWDINSSDEQILKTQKKTKTKVQQKDKQNEKENEVKEEKKIKKKVQFQRTSIERTGLRYKGKKKNEGGGDKEDRNKFKNIIQRINKEQSQTSIGIIPLNDSGGPSGEDNKKLFLNNTKDIKKSLKPKKTDVENVYNELNYFRMKLNISKDPVEETDTNKPPPQTIIYSIEKVMTELENQRIERTRMTNQMIDFGVGMTRDRLLKQTSAQNKLVTIRI